MINYHKYLSVSEDDKKWGLYVLYAGCQSIDVSGPYPLAAHPAHYRVNWNRQRVLHEFQVLYITKGEGIFESRQCPKTTIKEGTIIILFPGEWHRYEPKEQTGWDEYWVGFKGEVIENIISKNFFQQQSPLFVIGYNENILNLFLEIIEKTKQEKTGYQPLISGAVMHLLGKIYSISKQQYFETSGLVEQIVSKARIIFRENINQNISLEKIAEELQVGYSWFRKYFKKYTGMAPGQYIIQLRIERSKELLAYSNKPIKQISYELHFDSTFYFSRLFKKKTGVTPAEYRKKIGFRD